MALRPQIAHNAHRPTFPTVFLSLFVQFMLISIKCNGISEDGEILLQMKEMEWIDESNVLSNWNASDDDPCLWKGVFCQHYNNFSKFVTKIDLSRALIAGNLTSTICRLQNLKTLVLVWNKFGGIFPQGLLECKRLQKLVLSHNLFVGRLPDRIHEMAELRYLDLDGNNFSGSIPAGFGTLPSIEVLNLGQNLLNGTIPAFLGNLTTLKNLSMINNPFTSGIIPPEFGNLKRLQQLLLSECNLVGEIPSSFGNLRQIWYMDLGSNQLSGNIPASLMSLEGMTQLVLKTNNLTGRIPSNVDELKSIVVLDLSANSLSGRIPAGIGNLSQLEALYLFDNHISGAIPSEIEKLINLQALLVFNNQITGLLPQNLGYMNLNLIELDVSENFLSGPLPKNLCRGGKLQRLFLFSNNFNGSLPSFACKSLIKVQIDDNQMSGEVPLSIWESPLLTVLTLTNNSFEGRIPAGIAKSSLGLFEICNNGFSGRIPAEIGQVSNLKVFKASNNSLSGPIPDEITGLGMLRILLLHQNFLSGEIPKRFISWPCLTQLNLGNNQLTGTIPASLASLPRLNILDLSNNLLHGEIPAQLASLKLGIFNVSVNKLSGPIPENFDNLAYCGSFLGNPGLCGSEYLGLPSCASEKRSTYTFSKLWEAIPVSAAVICFMGLGCFLLICRNSMNFSGRKLSTPSWKMISFHRLRFSESDIIKHLTENNVIGCGGAGKVYKVSIGNGEVVAVKKFWNTGTLKDLQDKVFQAEVDILGKIRHASIVKLLCCISSADSDFKLLVYEYMPNGNLFECLHGSQGEILEWPTRYKIALGAAHGLCYLHHDCSPPIVHRDVKSKNILLDSEFEAQIGDFGLARIVEKLGQEDCMSVVAGSYGYIAPEYAYTMKVNEKSDIYSFGVVLLELVTGKEPTQKEFGEHSDIVGWIRNQISNEKPVQMVLDSRVNDWYRKEMTLMLKVALLCTNTLPIHRPSMREVVEMLLMCSPDEQVRKTVVTSIAPHLKRIPSAFKTMFSATSCCLKKNGESSSRSSRTIIISD